MVHVSELQSQSTDSAKAFTEFSGTVGITTNGFSIIPTFSLGKPAFIINLAFKRKRFSFEPDIRLVPDASKGGMIWWLRYRLIDQQKFKFRVGVHPAFSLIRRTDTENGSTKQITEMLRFFAYELVPSYQFTERFGVSAVFLQGNALQNSGPQLTRVLFLNSHFTKVPLGNKLLLNVHPTIFFLNTDGYRGNYFTITTALNHRNSPFALQATINQTFRSNVPNNKNFMWNVTLNYSFSTKVHS